MPSTYQKKPVEIEAVQWTGDNIQEVIQFAGDHVEYLYDTLRVFTLEGPVTASVGDYIIRGVKGEFYPCKPDIFEMTYEKKRKKEGINHEPC